MIGPRKKKMPDKKICTGCDVLLSKELGGSKRFPKKWTVYYCNHSHIPELYPGTQIAFIKRNVPWTPKWCPALKQKTNNQIQSDGEKNAAAD